MSVPNFLQYFKSPDLFGAFEQGMEGARSAENAKTQRMFADNQMRRQSAQEYREQQEFERRAAETERQHGIEQAQAVEHAGNLARMGRTGEAQALAHAYGIDMHPLMAAAAPIASEAPTQIDTSAQPLPSGENDVDAVSGGAPVSPTDDADLEGLMRDASEPNGSPDEGTSRAIDTAIESSRQEDPSAHPPMPLLYEAAIGPNKYQISAAPASTGFEPKYQKTFENFVALGISPEKAAPLVLAQKEKDDNAKAIADRTAAAITQRGDIQAARDEQYRMTDQERQRQFEIAEAGKNARAAAQNRSRERTAGAGGGDVASAIADHLTAHPGDVTGASKIAEAAGIHGQKAASLVGGIATDLGKKPPNAGGVDPSRIVRDLNGDPLGLAPSGRGGAAALQSDLRTNAEALRKLIKIRESGQTLAIGPEFHDAVLALAAITTAGKTDKTTEHEEGAITNWTKHMISRDGLDNKINQISARMQEIRSQLAPLPEGYTEERRRPGGTAPQGRALSPSELSGGTFLPDGAP